MNTNATVAEQIANFSSAEHVMNPEVEDWMRLLLADYLGVAFGGLSRDSSAAVKQAFAGQKDGEATRLDGARSIPEYAALVNGTIAHALELDDTYEEASHHPAVAIFPAVIAVSEAENATLGQLLEASAVGYEVMCRVGVLLGSAESYARGFHPTGVTGSIGAAAALANLLRLDEQQARNAIAIAANIAAGSLEFLADGAWTKRLNAGHAAANGVRAVSLARAGFDAPTTAIEGRLGFLHQYGEGLVGGRTFTLDFGSQALRTSIKFYPCCRYMHGNIDLLREIRRENPGLDVEEVTSIKAAVISAGASLVSIPAEKKLNVLTPVDAQFNMPFGAAVALAKGNVEVEDFDNGPAVAKQHHSLMRKVECYTDELVESAYPAEWHARVVVELKDGTIIEKSETAFEGSAEKRASWIQIEQKAAGILGEATSNKICDLAKTLPGQEKFPFFELAKDFNQN